MNDTPEQKTINPEPQPTVVVAGIPMTLDEYLATQKQAGKISRIFQWAWPVTAAFLAYITVALAANYGLADRFSWTVTWVVMAVIGTVVVQIVNRNRRKQMLANSYNVYRRMRGEQVAQLRFYTDHLEYISYRRRLAVPYTDVLAFREDEQKFALYTETTVFVLPARALTAAQAESVYRVLTAALPGDRVFCRNPMRPLLEQPISVPEIPDRPVTPPAYFNRPPQRMEEQRTSLEINTHVNSMRMLLSVLAGLMTALLIDPAGNFVFTDGLCILAWMGLSLLPVVLFSRHAVRTRPLRTIGMSLGQTGVTLYSPHGEMFVPREFLSVRTNGEALLVQTPLDTLYLRYADMQSTTEIQQYFQL